MECMHSGLPMCSFRGLAYCGSILAGSSVVTFARMVSHQLTDFCLAVSIGHEKILFILVTNFGVGLHFVLINIFLYRPREFCGAPGD